MLKKAHKNVKRCSKELVIGEEIKTTMCYLCMPTKMAKVETTDFATFQQEYEKLNLSNIVIGDVKWSRNFRK